LAPPAIHSFLARALFATRLFNVTITNVPGPPVPLYAFGARLREVWPLVPIAASHAVGIAVVSYDGDLFFCINADRDSVNDVSVLRGGMLRSLRELRERAAD
jgi:diacylglycerol O-acyltransferase / wax synthase